MGIVSWKDHKLNVLAKDQPPYQFQSWWDGNTQRERKITLSDTKPTVLAIYCAQDYWLCMSDEECCSGSCVSMSCTSESMDDSNVSKSEQEDDDSDNEPESEQINDVVSGEDHPINGFVNNMLEGDEENIKKGFNEDDEKKTEEDVANDLEGTDIEVDAKESLLVKNEGVEIDGAGDAEEVVEVVDAKEISKANNKELVENDIGHVDEYENIYASSQTVMQANAHSGDDKDNNENAGLEITGIVFIIMTCLMISFVVVLECYWKTKKKKRTPSTVSRGGVDKPLGTGDFHSNYGDEENCPSDIPDTNINSAADTIAGVKSVGSTSFSDQDVLNN